MEKIFLTEHIHDDAVAYLKEHFEVVQGTSVEPAEIIHQAQGCAGILIRSAKITAEIMDAIPTLKVVAKHGMGVDNIDVAHATEKGILVVNAPYSNMNAVAEHIVTLLLALISVILMIVLFDPQQDASRVYYGTDTRAFSLLFGALLAILWEYRMVPRRLSASVNMVLGSVSFAVLLVMTIAINGSSNFWYRGGQLKQKANGSESEDTICTADLTDDEILEGLNLLLIGDSIAVDVTDDFYEIFPNSVSDTKIGRITSLGKQVLDSYIDEKKWEGEGVIFASLSNSPINGELEDIREKIGKDNAIVSDNSPNSA